MNDASLVEQLRNKNFSASKIFFERYYGRMLALCRRYTETNTEALNALFELYDPALNHILDTLSEPKENIWPVLETGLIKHLVEREKSKGLAFHVSNTVHPKAQNELNFDLFAQNERIDIRLANRETILLALNQLSAAHRLVYNLCAIDCFSLEAVAELMDYSLETVRTNFEKARFLLHKSIEQHLIGNRNV